MWVRCVASEPVCFDVRLLEQGGGLLREVGPPYWGERMITWEWRWRLGHSFQEISLSGLWPQQEAEVVFIYPKFKNEDILSEGLFLSTPLMMHSLKLCLPGVLLLAALVVLLLCIYALVKRRRVEKYPTIRKTENDLSYRAGKDRQLPDCNFVTDANIGCGQYSPFQENCYGNPVWKSSPNCLHAISQKNCLHWIQVDTKSNNRKIFYCLLDCTGHCS